MIKFNFQGPRGGLRLVLNAETYDSLASWDMSSGFLVAITHPNDTKMAVNDLALQVSTGAQTYIGLDTTEVSLRGKVNCKLKGTVPRSSGARISRLTQGPLMSSCKHFG